MPAGRKSGNKPLKRYGKKMERIEVKEGGRPVKRKTKRYTSAATERSKEREAKARMRSAKIKKGSK